MKHTFLLAALLGGALVAFAPAASAHSCGATLGPKQGVVDSTCKPESKITCVKGGPAKSCKTLIGLLNAAKACKAARIAVNACYNPPDKGHKDAVTVVGGKVTACSSQKQGTCAGEKKTVADAACVGKAAATACNFKFLDEETGDAKDFAGTCGPGKPARILTCKPA